MKKEDNIIKMKVSSKTSVQSLASSIAKSVTDNQTPVLTAIGASSVNQAVKACTVAKGHLAVAGKSIALSTGFKTIDIDGQTVSGIEITVVEL